MGLDQAFALRLPSLGTVFWHLRVRASRLPLASEAGPFPGKPEEHKFPVGEGGRMVQASREQARQGCWSRPSPM